MQFVLEGPDDRIIFPMNPEGVSVKNNLQQITFSVQDLGGIAFPSGRDPTVYSWQGVFPGPARANLPFIHKPYRFPIDLVARLDSWYGVVPGNKPVKLELTVTSPHPTDPAPIVKTVFLSGWSYDISGGYGDYNYQLELTEWRTLLIPVDAPEEAAPDTQIEEDTSLGEARPDPGPANEYIVKPGDSLIRIAAIELGSADRWPEIFEINRDPTIPGFTDPNLILDGWVLRLPGPIGAGS